MATWLILHAHRTKYFDGKWIADKFEPKINSFKCKFRIIFFFISSQFHQRIIPSNGRVKSKHERFPIFGNRKIRFRLYDLIS